MRTLRNRNDLNLAIGNLCELWTTEKLLDDLIIYLGDDKVRRFVDDIIREWDIEDIFSDYEEFAEED